MEEGRREREKKGNSIEIGGKRGMEEHRETKGRKNISRVLFNKIERSVWHQSSKLTSGQAHRERGFYHRQ